MKNLLNLGNSLNKAEQKSIIGGDYPVDCSDLYSGLELFQACSEGTIISKCRYLCEM